jgi:hypothetical protein
MPLLFNIGGIKDIIIIIIVVVYMQRDSYNTSFHVALHRVR